MMTLALLTILILLEPLTLALALGIMYKKGWINAHDFRHIVAALVAHRRTGGIGDLYCPDDAVAKRDEGE